MSISMSDFVIAPAIVYTRARAIADGVLVDMTEWASGTNGIMGGFEVPVAVSASIWKDINSIPAAVRDVQSVRGRAHDVLWMAFLAAAEAKGRDVVTFAVMMSVAGRSRRQYRYKMVYGPNDNGSPCVTILQLHEDLYIYSHTISSISPERFLRFNGSDFGCNFIWAKWGH